MTYPSQYGPPQPQQYGGNQPGPYGYGAPPPKKNNSAVLATVMFVVVLIAGVGITGFVAPGFFLSDDSGDGGAKDDGGSGGASDGGPAEGAGGGDAGAQAFAKKLVTAADQQDDAVLGELACTEAKTGVRQAIREIGVTDGAELVDTREVSATEYLVVVDISYNGKSAPFTATIADTDGAWCWMDFAQGAGGGSGGSAPTSDEDGPASGPGDPDDSGGSADGKSTMHRFLDAVNAKDTAAATKLYCADAIDTNAESVIAKNPDLKLSTVGSPSGSFHMAKVDGTLDGQPVKGGSMAVKVKGSGAPCVYSFAAR